jgi:hypothetical protein
MVSQGLETQNREDIKFSQNVMIPNHHKRKHGLNTTNKKMAQTQPKNLKLNVEDHITSMPTGHGRKPIPRIGS